MASVRKKADFEAGIFFTLFGASTAILSLQYPLGSIALMGPGMFPFILGIFLTALGLIILSKSLFSLRGDPARSFPLRVAVAITASLLVFALMAETAGLAITVLAQVFIALLASDHFTFKRATLLGVGLLIFCYLVFIRLLGIAIPLIPV